ncbi:MAG: DUF3303 family protein [Acidobacteria bacterium]|nr:DUF3303 family protein [Acidobacteriota bacterium]
MLFMVIERFKEACEESIAERFRLSGRMLPQGVVYHASWIDPREGRCFQVMEAPGLESLNAWAANWSDLVEFEIIQVLPSAAYWSARVPEQG